MFFVDDQLKVLRTKRCTVAQSLNIEKCKLAACLFIIPAICVWTVQSVFENVSCEQQIKAPFNILSTRLSASLYLLLTHFSF